MAKVGYGFVRGKQNRGLNNLFDSLKSQTFNARVVDIILSESHPRFAEAGEWNGLGSIVFNSVDDSIQNELNYPLAKPIFPNIKIYPLKNELVYCIRLVNSDINENTGQREIYYFPPISIWNHPHHNAIPNVLNDEDLPEYSKQDYPLTEAGNVRRVSDNSTEINLGKTFKERSNIHPLLPFEGDVIMEGRWGNSIRFGSTVKGQIEPNEWSSTGTNGDPITVLRNGQGQDPGALGESSNEGWLPITELINNDDSSIYLASTQKIPINISSTNNYVSYNSNPPQSPKDYSGKQILINSGRLVFNTTQDHLLLTSKKSINLNAVSSVNIETTGPIILSTTTWENEGGVYLGSKNETEPVLLGEQTVELLNKLLIQLSNLSFALSVDVVPPGGGKLVLTSQAASQLNDTLAKLNPYSLLSKRVRTA